MNNFLETLKISHKYIPATVHFNKRRSDGVFEIIGRLTDEEYLALGVNCGPEIVLATAPDRSLALKTVQYLRGHN